MIVGNEPLNGMRDSPRSHAWLGWFAGLLAVAILPTKAAAQEMFTGTWTIQSVTVAPWAAPPVPGIADNGQEVERQFMGEDVAIGSKAIIGPPTLSCLQADFAISDKGPEMLFEGSLNGPDQTGAPRDPAALAKSLGVTTPTVKALHVSCSEVEYYMLDENTVIFGLDNRVFTMKRAGKT